MKQKFKIEHIDPLGQGVSKQSEKVSFIRKTLPGEEGQSEILKKSKGVLFGDPISLSQESPRRIRPICPHFSQCPSCHFLHTDWEYELSLKTQTLEKEIQKRLRHSSLIKSGAPLIQTHKAKQRTAYRNRIQLHYDLKKNKLGYIDPLKKKIVETPHCLMGTPAIQKVMTELYATKWSDLVPPNAPGQGHVELIERSSGVERVWNSNYSSGGFTQVHQQMNEVLVELVTDKIQKATPQHGVWDLFGGNGNLTQRIPHLPTLVSDCSQQKKGRQNNHLFIESDLYDKDCLNLLREHSWFAPDLILLDPPRSGFKQLKEFLKELKPRTCLYVSCDLSTQLRDLLELDENYSLKEVHLLDMFASTYHFETVFHLQINDDKR